MIKSSMLDRCMAEVMLYAILFALAINAGAIYYVFEHFSTIFRAQGNLIDKLLIGFQPKEQEVSREPIIHEDLGFDITGNEVLQSAKTECE